MGVGRKVKLEFFSGVEFSVVRIVSIVRIIMRIIISEIFLALFW